MLRHDTSLRRVRKRIGASIAHAFHAPPRARRVIILLHAIINGIVLYNVARHDVHVGYDASDHLGYARTLAQWRLPGPQDSSEFFSPPLPYAIGASPMLIGRSA